MLYKIPESDYLAHHGIKGQKWGQQNGPPYPLKPEDKSVAEKRKSLRIISGQHDDVKKQKIQNGSNSQQNDKPKENDDQKEEKKKPSPKDLKKLTSKDINDLSDAELIAIKNRLNLEADYKRAINSSKEQSKGRKICSELINKIGNKLLERTATYVSKQIGDKLFGIDASDKPKDNKQLTELTNEMKNLRNEMSKNREKDKNKNDLQNNQSIQTKQDDPQSQNKNKKKGKKH